MLKAQINERESIERMAGRLDRLRKSIKRADGARKDELQKEIDGILERLTSRRALLERALRDPAEVEAEEAAAAAAAAEAAPAAEAEAAPAGD